MDLYPFSDEQGYTGFIDKNGDVKIPSVTLRIVEDFHEDRAAAKTYSNNKCGYIDFNGEWVIEPKYDFVGPFVEGRAIVGLRNRKNNERKYYIIDRSGEIVWDVPTNIIIEHKKCPNLIPISNGDKCAYTTPTGKLVTDYEFYDAYPFSDDVGLVQLSKANRDGNYEWGYLNKDGTILNNASLTASRAFSFNEGFARLQSRVGVEDRYYYINKNAERMNDLPFSLAGSFSEGRAYVKGAGKGAGVWYINTEFQEVLSPDYKFSIYNYSNGLVVVRDNKYDLYGYADRSGKVVIECNYSNNKTMSFKNNLAYVVRENRRNYFSGSRIRYINYSGETVFEMNREMTPHNLSMG
ncbi:WG repeat-containing protein [Gorillibacterium timonense]|uniref:WG repeat-containing protein n=1 Tax=Gorillibacterium timonense TaxID=1689269 RepID=UPI00071C4928|nr:WG repeat-containing protein [Gorillibacterium timonense]